MTHKFKILEEEEPKGSTWTDLESAICDANNVAYMHSCSVEERVGQDEKEFDAQQNAIVYGAYKLQELLRDVKEVYNKLFDEVRAVRVERDEVVPLDDGGKASRKVASVHLTGPIPAIDPPPHRGRVFPFQQAPQQQPQPLAA
jgi:hypothetical protein